MRHALVFLTLLCTLCLAGVANAAADKELRSGELMKMISDAKGKVVIVNFFASWCPPCKEEIPGLIRTRAKFPADKVELIGVSLDEDEKQYRNFAAKTPFNYPTYRAGQELVGFYNISSIPQLLVYDKAGRLVINEVGLVEANDLIKAVSQLLEQK